MEAFTLVRPATPDAAHRLVHEPSSAYIAGGTDLLQLMKNGAVAPPRVIDLAGLASADITADGESLSLGALARMADVAAHPAVRQSWPAISQALLQSASPQVRNMGTMGGNLLQRTRCGYFRDTGFPCNKRQPGSGCPAIAGDSRNLAVFGVSDHCIATHPSDLPVALMAMDASVVIASPDGTSRTLRLAEFYRLPGDTPHVETVLRPGEIITAVLVPASPAAAKSVYLKVRDRTSFAFALVSVAVALHVDGETVADARVAIGGVAPMPWRLPEVEQALIGQRHDDALFARAAAVAGQGAKTTLQNQYKVDLVQRAVRRALQMAAA